MADYEGNGLAAFNDARSRGWGGSVTLADLEKLSAGNPIAHGIAAVWPDAPPSRMDQAYQTSIDRWKQLGKDAFFAPANGLKAFMDAPTFSNALGVMPMGGIGKMPAPAAGKFMAPSVSTVPEKLKSAAVRYADEIFEAPIHGIALDQAGRKYGMGVYSQGEHGFTTSTGRFVSREEAEAIARAQDQLAVDNPGRFRAEHLKPGTEDGP